MKKKARNSYIITTLSVLVLIFILAYAIEDIVFSSRFGFNAKVAGVDVSLKSREEAIRLVSEKKNEILNESIALGEESYQTKDLVTDFDISQPIDEALAAQSKKFYRFSVFSRQETAVRPIFNTYLQKILLQEYGKRAKTPIDATLKGDLTKINPEQNGQRLMLVESREKIAEDVGFFENKSGFVIARLTPMVSEKEAAKLVDKAKEVTGEPVTLLSDRGDFEIKSTELKKWLKIMPKNPKSIVKKETYLPLESDEYGYFDRSKILTFLETIAAKTDASRENARLAVTDGAVRVVEQEKKGYKLDRADAAIQIEEAAISDKVAELKIETTLADVRSDNLAELGINELISRGWSNFSGSPKNRIHNIRTGAAKFNGILIAPNEKFSFNTTLGPVDASTGYLPELVILENKTTPQYGGGLCQVSSTAFRAALNAGFPILERKMHAYPVKYYKPYGVDATIYLPKPDLVFRNDSGHYILVQTMISGTKLYFDFYGTKTANTFKFAGNSQGIGGVTEVEEVSPAIYDQGVRGPGSFTAKFYRFVYDGTNKLIRTDSYTSRYDSPDKYPH